MKVLANLIAVSACAVMVLLSLGANAANAPCSGSKGGISHCQGDLFICNNGDVSQSKRACSASLYGTGGGLQKRSIVSSSSDAESAAKLRPEKAAAQPAPARRNTVRSAAQGS